MKANRRARADEGAGAETVGAIILFGIFVSAIAFLNVTAVPAAGLELESAHHDAVLGAFNGLQGQAEASATPGNGGATVSASVDLAPERQAGSDFFSFFLAKPARSSGEITFVADYGNVTVTHDRQGSAATIVDVGSLTQPFPVGRLAFDPHPVFRPQGVVQLENGGLVTTQGSTATLRHDPPIALVDDGTTTHVVLKVRVLNGTSASLGGSSTARVALEQEAATLTAPAAPNALRVALTLDTGHAAAWAAFLDALCDDAGLPDAACDATVTPGIGHGGLDRVAWNVEGRDATDAANDIRLTTGLAVYRVTLS